MPSYIPAFFQYKNISEDASKVIPMKRTKEFQSKLIYAMIPKP